MSNTVRLIHFSAVVAVVTVACGAVAMGCGGNDDNNSPAEVDAGKSDATTDVSADVGSRTDGQNEAAASDATLGSDANAAGDADSATAVDADAGAIVEAASEGDADAGIVDAAPRYDGSAASFPGQVAAATCERVAACCGVSANSPKFNFAACQAAVLPSGFNGSSTDSDLLDGGHIAFDPIAAAACISALNQIDCDTNQIPSAVERAAYLNCFAAFTGTLPSGAPCAANIECDPTNFCLPIDGGVGDAGAIGLCQPLVADGGACGNLLGTSTNSQPACSYRASGNTGLFCKSFDPSNPTVSVDAAAWVCAPEEPNGTACSRNLACSSFECTAGTLQCAESLIAVTSATCTTFAVDAGTDASGD
jgi:hypothetical protein